ncbi:hypothetical protein SYJ56_15805 [Algoriphagus sp. D3-2-R+10]|uniref:type II toxin-antitoxin system VapB15 family antitoxin n=1 Tax=Algoriphagus aurantiacus TaxID=3103948 RepID=UPI002B3C0A04|nr:hypothetical protein [Algoriphagus sp. D3-2-R+10]MEB2776791.1 hypothetical protein [Algoriphagus sp. D3-2-R+10]
MKTELQIDLSFEKILSIVKRLPRRQKLLLSKELEKELIDSKLTQLLKSFKTDYLDLDALNHEIESVRQEIYEERKDQSNF